MIAIVRDLMIKLVGLWMKTQHPRESPKGFIENVWRAVGTGLSEVVEVIGEGVGFVFSEFVGQQHLRGGVAGVNRYFS